jgi:hemolysin activation/secretion protein
MSTTTRCKTLLILLASAMLCGAGPAHTQPRDSAPAGAEAAQEAPRFDILEYQVEGNTVLPTLAVEKAVYPHLGESKTVADVERARQALERAYHSAGYLTVLVDIPEQKVDEGIVRLSVIEGRVERVRVSGNRYYARGYIRSKVPSLAQGEVPYFPQVQTEMATLNRSADKQVTPVLRPGTTPGTVEVELKVQDELPLHGGLELNNRQSPSTEPLRLQGFLRYDNLWQREHSASVQYQVAPQDTTQVRALSGTYVLPVSESDNAIALYGVRSKSDVATIGDLNVLGNATIFGGRFIMPLAPREGVSQSLTLGIDYKDFGESVKVQGSDDVNTPIAYTPMLLQYSMTQIGRKGQTQASIGANFAMRSALLGNTDAEFENKRFKAQANYFYLRGDLQRDQLLPKGFRLIARADGQWSGQPLVSNEQFAAGGVDSVRGYLEAEQFGDDGLRGSLELRTPGFASGSVDELLALGFVEGARLWVLDPLPQQQSAFSLSSAGVGLRLRAYRHLNASLDVGWPFQSAQETRSGEPRLHFKLAYEF